MRLPEAILFDLDDTIITEGERLPILAQTAAELEGELGGFQPGDIADRLESALQTFWARPAEAKIARLGAGFGIRKARESVITETFEVLGLSRELALQFCDRFSALRAESTRLFDGARSTIETLRELGVKLALVTNGASDIQRAKLERFALTALFGHVQIEGEHGFGKPEHRAYRHAMQALGVEASGTWMVGDNLEWEVAAPRELGIYAIWHDHLGKGLPAGTLVRPDRIIRSLPELLAGVSA